MTRREAQALLDALAPGRELVAAVHRHRLTGDVVGASASWRGHARWCPTLAQALREVVGAAYAAAGRTLPTPTQGAQPALPGVR